MATAIPYAELNRKPQRRRRVGLGAIVGTLVFAIAVFVVALALIA